MNAPITKTPSVHQALIQELCDEFPEVRTKGFFRALRQLGDAEYTTSLLADDPQWARRVRFVPDAWAINYERRVATIFEVVVNHDLTPNKYGRMVDLAWALDEDYWSLCLIRCDEAGRQGYDPQLASLMSAAEQPGTGYKWEVPNWKRYTHAKTFAWLAEQQAIPA